LDEGEFREVGWRPCKCDGYLFVVGDCYLSTLLIGPETGEVVHIDRGGAFEHSGASPIQAQAGVIDGMRRNGFESVFRRTCQQTIAIPRTSNAYVLVIL
jgi:hypothetical protein